MSALRLLVVASLAVALAGAEPVLAKDACQVEVGLVANGYGELGGQSATGSFLVDDTLTGSGFIDSEGDGDQSTPLAWEAIDCELLPYPPP